MHSEIDDRIRQEISTGKARIEKTPHCTIIYHNNPTLLLPQTDFQAYQIWKK